MEDRHRTSLPAVADPEPSVGNKEVGGCSKSVKENYPHSFATPLCAPSEVDLRRFWYLERPLDLSNPFDRDTLHRWIQESIDQSCDWIDVRKSCQEHEPLDAAVHQALLDEAYHLLSYKRACMALLATLEEPPAPKPPQATNLTDDEIKALRATIRHWQEALARSSAPKAVKPQSLMRERYGAAWAQKQSLR
jgi:hypothetical protein